MKSLVISKKNEKELQILRDAVEIAEETTGKRLAKSSIITDIISILENFLKKKKLVCYGGTAINNILSPESQFYNKNVEIPDYDFFSPNAMENAKELADIYYKKGYKSVEAKAGVHEGTYKVYVKFIPIADITFCTKEIFTVIKRNALNVDGILYAPPDYLRMSMYLELSRPEGDVSRWEKVYKRLKKINKEYPIQYNCKNKEYNRPLKLKKEGENLFNIIKNTVIDDKCVFFGGYAHILFSNYVINSNKSNLNNVSDFDILSKDPLKLIEKLKINLINNGFEKINVSKKNGAGEIISTHYQLEVDGIIIAYIYEPLACHSYNEITIKGEKIRIATIDTLLSFYLAFLYTDRDYYNKDKIICQAELLFKLQELKSTYNKGIFQRYNILCYGEQETIESIRKKKAEMYNKLRLKKNSKEYEKYFLRYTPSEKKFSQTIKTITSGLNKTRSRKSRKSL